MNSQEYTAWHARAVLMFPQIKRFFEEAGAGAKMLSREWASAVSAIDADEANAFLDAMRNGDIETPGNFWADWATLPAMVRKFAREQQALRQSASRPSVTPEWAQTAKHHSQGGTVDSGKLLASLVGKDPAERRRLLDENFPPTDPDRQPRFRCPHCQDNSAGLVPVWRTYVALYVQKFWRDDVPANWREQLTAVMRRNKVGTHQVECVVCICEGYAPSEKRRRIEAERERGGSDKQIRAIFDPARMCVCRNHLDIDPLREFVADKSAAMLAGKEWQPSAGMYEATVAGDFDDGYEF